MISSAIERMSITKRNCLRPVMITSNLYRLYIYFIIVEFYIISIIDLTVSQASFFREPIKERGKERILFCIRLFHQVAFT